jgi:hypothetical protein
VGWWRDVWRGRAQDWIAQPLGASQVPGSVAPDPIPLDVYLSIFLASLRVVDVRRGIDRFYGAVDSTISLPHRTRGRAEFHVVTTPTELHKIDAKHVDRVVQLDRRLLGPVPYRGGDLAVEIGLFSIKEADLAAPFLTLLERISALAGVASMGTALMFAEPLRRGIELLTGASDDSILEVGIAGEFAHPQGGYFLVMRARRDQVDVDSLHVDPITSRVVDSRGQPVADYPYMLLRTEISRERPDWFQIAELREPHGELLDDVRQARYRRVPSALAVFQRAAMTCPDLLAADASRLADLVEAEVKAVMKTTKTAGGVRPVTPLEMIPLFGRE